MTAAEIERLLITAGFGLVSQKGSHRKWRHPTLRLQVIVPQHAGQTLPLGTIAAIAKGAELNESDWRD